MAVDMLEMKYDHCAHKNYVHIAHFYGSVVLFQARQVNIKFYSLYERRG